LCGQKGGESALSINFKRLTCFYSKMVNLNSRVPFNLQNKKIAVTLDPSPSSRGSASLSSHSRSHTNGQAHWQVQAHVGAVTNNIPSSSSSITSQDGVSADFEGFTRSPILNLRLVRPTFTAGVPTGRGRARRRGGDGNLAELADTSTGEVGENGILKNDEGFDRSGPLPSSHTTTVGDGTPRQPLKHLYHGVRLTASNIFSWL
jgi:hypothetical protein